MSALHSSSAHLAHIQMQVAIVLDRHMKRTGLTTRELSERIGVSQEQIKHMRNGTFNGRMSVLFRVMIAIGRLPVVTYNTLD